MRRNNYPLRLQPWLMEEARKVAESEGVSLNRLINIAVAEQLSALRTEQRLWERITRGNRSQTPQILDRGGIQNPPTEGEELLLGGLQVPPAPAPNCAPVGESTRETGSPFGRATPQFGKLKKRLEKAKGR